MERTARAAARQHDHVRGQRQKLDSLKIAATLWLLVGSFAAAQSRVAIVLPAKADLVEQAAASELATHLHVLYPSTAFRIGNSADGHSIYLGTEQDLPGPVADAVKRDLAGQESFAVKTLDTGSAVIAGASPRATLYAVNALLEKLGFGFYLSYNTAPPSSHGPFSFAGWALRDQPIIQERVIFNWHNFLSGCSTWNLDDWKQWIVQAERMRFNTVMVHAYGNNPMYSFSLNGQTKPTGYLSNTELGRDWGTEHVMDVRTMVGADGLFNGPVYGADASLVPEGDRVHAAQSLMQHVFHFAAARGMGVTFALDVDTESANPQNVIATLPASARFATHGFELVNPDTPEGYAYYRAEIEQLMQLYPQITQLAVWFRGATNSPWRGLRPEEFPAAWQTEWNAALAANRRLRNDPDAPSMFAIARIARAFRKALNETGHHSVTLSAGSWRFDFLPSADAFMPRGVALMPLDYDYAFPSDPVQERLRVIGRHRPMVPIVWAQHDDREFAGRSYTPFGGFGSMLRWSNSNGYGVIHWTTRPLDLYFKNIADQVWTASLNETLDATTSAMALRTFGTRDQALGQRYLLDWIYDAPAFGRETSDRFLDQIVDANNEAPGAHDRLALLRQMEPLAATAAQRDWIGYFEDWERYAQDVFHAQAALQDSLTSRAAGNDANARSAIGAANPQAAIEQYARAIRHGVTSPGEKGILITLNLRWLPAFEAQRQALGLDPLRVEFAPTHHEPSAQGPGHFSFAFGADQRLVEVLGTKELGTEVKVFANSPQCPSGIEMQTPVTLAVGGLAGTLLPDGVWRLKLEMPSGTQVEVEAGGKSQIATPGSEIEVTASGGRVHLALSPAGSPARICGLTLQAQSAAK